MQRWQTYGARDTPLKSEGDAAFVGIDMTRDRGALPPGMIARGENNRMREGNCRVRPGNILPGEFQAPFIAPFLGSAIYSNPNGNEVMLVADSGGDYVWQLRAGQVWKKILFEPGVDLVGDSVEFCQAFEKVLLMRKPIPGGATTNLVWDGNEANTFDYITMSTFFGGGTLTPATWNAEPFKNRVLLYNARDPTVPWRDQIQMSDVLDYSQCDDILGKFRINAAESDIITRVWGYYQGAVVVFKARSLHLLSNFTVDPFFAVQNMLTRRLGLACNKGVTEDGHDLLFISEPGGIYRLSEVIQEQIATEARPVSDPIQPIVDRINWEGTAQWGCAQTIKDYAYFGVCLDDVTDGCNALLVLNLATRQWESAPDVFGDQTLRLNALHVTKAEHGLALYGLDYTAAKIYHLFGGNDTDEVGDVDLPIVHTIETRGYTLGVPDEFKRFDRAAVAVATSNPNAELAAITDGAYEVKVIKTITKDRTRFYPQASPDYIAGFSDAVAPYRKDYSVVPDTDPNFVGEDFDDLDAGAIDELPATPVPAVPVSIKQQSVEPLPVRANGRWLSIRSVNSTGTCDILSVGVEGRSIRARQVAA